MEHKSFAVGELKALPEDSAPAGSFEALVSVFGNVDRGGDRMVKGAFTRSLAEKGMPPVVWSHMWDVPPVGTVTSAEETDEGLLVKGRLFVGPDEDHAVARQVYTAMKNGALKEFSFGYETVDSREVKSDGETVRELLDVDLFEVGPTLVGMNPDTRLVGVKAREAKAGRVLSQENFDRLARAEELVHTGRAGNDRQQLAEAETLIELVLAQVDPSYQDPDDPTKSRQQAETKDSGDKAEPNDPPETPVVSEEARSRIADLFLAEPDPILYQEA
jgi:HK97 family phage prohead protease